MVSVTSCWNSHWKKKKIYCLYVSHADIWSFVSASSKCFKLTGRTQQMLPHTYLMQINQSYAIIWYQYFQQILIKFWLKKSDVYHMHVRFLVHAVNWSVLFIRTCGLSSASARQTSLLCLGFLLLYSALLLFSVIGVYLGTSLPSPYMLCSNVRILVLRSRHVPDISVPQLTIYIW